MGDRQEAARKRRQTIIDRHYDGSEEAYLEDMRRKGSKGGKSARAKGNPGSIGNLSPEKRKEFASKGGRSYRGKSSKELHEKRPAKSQRGKQ